VWEGIATVAKKGGIKNERVKKNNKTENMKEGGRKVEKDKDRR